ncbi:MAG: hypothetical protein ACLQBB_10905 [Solirubrobacteraceae bacterium]
MSEPRAAAGPLTFGRLRAVSFIHSCVYLALLICAFALGGPQPETFILGLSHGLLWIAMSLACLAAARLRIVSLRLAVAVAVLGGIGPFFGSYEFIREGRRRERQAGAGGQAGRAPAGAPKAPAPGRPADGSPR